MPLQNKKYIENGKSEVRLAVLATIKANLVARHLILLCHRAYNLPYSQVRQIVVYGKNDRKQQRHPLAFVGELTRLSDHLENALKPPPAP